MKKITKHILRFVFGIILLNIVSCAEDEVIDVPGGDFYGYIYPYSKSDIDDYSGVTIKLDGSVPLLKATSDSSGRYEFKNVPSGTYTLIFEKEGYCTHQFDMGEFIAGSTLQSVDPFSLYLIPNVEIENTRVTIKHSEWTNDIYTLEADFTKKNSISSINHFQFYYSTDKHVSYKNYDLTMNLHEFDNKISFDLSSVFNDTQHFKAGDEIYIIIYPSIYSWNEYQSYTDINSGKEIITSIAKDSPSEIVHVTVPDNSVL